MSSTPWKTRRACHTAKPTPVVSFPLSMWSALGPAVERRPSRVNYEFVEGVTPDKARELVQWLKSARPETAFSDEMQELFGGETAFDWAIPEHDGAPSAVPAFQPLGTVGTRGQEGST